MTSFRNRPLEVSAVRWTGANLDEISSFTAGNRKVVYDPSANSLFVATPDGQRRCATGDWLVRGPNWFYPLDDTTFVLTYEEVDAVEVA